MRQGQSIFEYALLIAAVAAALGAMHSYVQRSAQASLKLIERQVSAEQLASSGGGATPVPPSQEPGGGETSACEQEKQVCEAAVIQGCLDVAGGDQNSPLFAYCLSLEMRRCGDAYNACKRME